MYSIIPKLSDYINKRGESAVLFQVIYGKVKVYPAAGVKVKPNQWKKNQVVNHELKGKLNAIIRKKHQEIENILIDLKGDISAKELSRLLSGERSTSLNFIEFTREYKEQMKFKFSKGRLKHYGVIANKIQAYKPHTLLSEINALWLQKFENWLREHGLKTNTIRSKIAIIKAIVKAAKMQHLISAYDFDGYANVKVIQDEPEFLTETELQKFFDVCRAVQQPSIKLAGYYFLLSCFSGLRLGDAKKFNYETYIINDEIIIRAQKNKKIVTIPLHTNLIEVLEFIRDKPMHLAEETIRKCVKQIAILAGIKKHVKYHTSRHTWAMLLMSKGFTIDEVAKTIGDTAAVARIYAKVSNEQLNNKIKDRLN